MFCRGGEPPHDREPTVEGSRAGTPSARRRSALVPCGGRLRRGVSRLRVSAAARVDAGRGRLRVRTGTGGARDGFLPTAVSRERIPESIPPRDRPSRPAGRAERDGVVGGFGVGGERGPPPMGRAEAGGVRAPGGLAPVELLRRVEPSLREQDPVDRRARDRRRGREAQREGSIAAPRPRRVPVGLRCLHRDPRSVRSGPPPRALGADRRGGRHGPGGGDLFLVLRGGDRDPDAAGGAGAARGRNLRSGAGRGTPSFRSRSPPGRPHAAVVGGTARADGPRASPSRLGPGSSGQSGFRARAAHFADASDHEAGRLGGGSAEPEPASGRGRRARGMGYDRASDGLVVAPVPGHEPVAKGPAVRGLRASASRRPTARTMHGLCAAPLRGLSQGRTQPRAADPLPRVPRPSPVTVGDRSRAIDGSRRCCVSSFAVAPAEAGHPAGTFGTHSYSRRRRSRESFPTLTARAETSASSAYWTVRRLRPVSSMMRPWSRTPWVLRMW